VLPTVPRASKIQVNTVCVHFFIPYVSVNSCLVFINMISLPFVKDLWRISSPICSWPSIFCVHTSAILLLGCLPSPKFVVTQLYEVNVFTNLLWPHYPKFTHSPICCDSNSQSSHIRHFVGVDQPPRFAKPSDLIHVRKSHTLQQLCVVI